MATIEYPFVPLQLTPPWASIKYAMVTPLDVLAPWHHPWSISLGQSPYLWSRALLVNQEPALVSALLATSVA
eukprot:9197190-Karenia_brevis.AAC.1